MITVSQFSGGTLPHGWTILQFFSAFSPQLHGFIDDVLPIAGEPDHYNNWEAMLPPNNTEKGTVGNGAEFWIQLANSSIVCALTNTSFSIDYLGVNGAQRVSQNNVTFLNRWTYDHSSANYLSVMAFLGPMLYGNVTVEPYSCDVGDFVDAECYMLSGSSSEVLQTGIGACQEFDIIWWDESIDRLNGRHKNLAIDFGTEPFTCRNKSVARANEDLSVNVTNGLLGLDLYVLFPISKPPKTN